MPGGRPTDYREEYAEQAYKLALLGLTDAEMAVFFGIAESTFYRWMNVHPEFAEATARGKEPADAQVAASLYHRAKGYSHEAVKIFMPSGAGEPVYAPYTEHYPPDTQAASWWLKNRQGAKWRDKTEIEHGGTVKVDESHRLALEVADIFGLPPPKRPAAELGGGGAVVHGKADGRRKKGKKGA